MSKKKPTARPAAASAAPPGPMNIDLLSDITRLMKENDLTAVDVRDGDRRIVLHRGGGPAHATAAPVYAAPVAAAPAPVSVAAAPAVSANGGAPASGGAGSAADDANLSAIKSPMVGTVYLKPSPDAKPYVNAGGSIGADTVVCLIEAMKVFNEIKAETTGTIAKILVTDGQTVEFGQTLFLVKN